jgi:hypothetical protein
MRGSKNARMGLYGHIKNGNNPFHGPLGWTSCDALVAECIRLGYIVLEPLGNKFRLTPTNKIPLETDFNILDRNTDKITVSIDCPSVTNWRFWTSFLAQCGVETMRKLVDFVSSFKYLK